MDATAEAAEQRVAVVFIHGQGEQRPMEDVRELSRTIWDADPKRMGPGGAQARSWVVPDARLGDADLGRVTTAAVQSGLRVDFFELYWAHLMADNRAVHVVSWFRSLLARARREAPRALLPVRQGAIRFIECITLMAVVFMFTVGLLLPQAVDDLALGADRLAGLWLPTPESLVWGFAMATLVFLACAILNLLINEALGGGGATALRHMRPLGLRLRSLLLNVAVWCVPALSLFAFAAVVLAGLLQGPLLQWGDARPLVFALAMLSALGLAVRRLEFGLYIGLIGAGVALVCALFGGVDEANAKALLAAEFLRPEAVTAAIAEADASLLRQADAAMSAYLPYVLMAVFAFATLWFVLGLISLIAKARTWLLRLVLTIGIASAGAWFGFLIQHTLFQSAPFVWVMYAVGVTLFFTFVLMGAVGGVAAFSFLVPVMADSARYLSRGPDHVNARRLIRQAGVDLLDRLHGPYSGYDRVVVVAHSLGTVVGYELLLDYWARFSGTYVMEQGDRLESAIRHLEERARLLNRAPQDAARLRALREAQHQVGEALRQIELEPPSHGAPEGKTWLITDFITLGSPLTHSSLLMADGVRHFWRKLANRELSACPPIAFNAGGDPDPEGTVTFKGWDGKERPNHSSVFAAVRWTNHYFKTGEFIFEGDVIGGPVGGVMSASVAEAARAAPGGFGAGVRDVELDWRSTGKVFAHNEYWRSALDTRSLCEALRSGAPTAEHIAALIAAINLEERAQGA